LQAEAGQAFHAVRFDGDIYDCGAKLGFLAANVAYGLADPVLGADLRAALKALL
jgi:UTP--glucose-1-phosphate uridylyltransferase